jgi:hypothetical protein
VGRPPESEPVTITSPPASTATELTSWPPIVPSTSVDQASDPPLVPGRRKRVMKPA